jgi:O-antigen/teichoic acid export membrane protein
MLGESVRLLFVTMFPVIFAFVVFARPGLQSWLGHEIADQGSLVMQILAVGVLLNALAQGPATLIQAAGEPRWMAKLHLAELPLFVLVLWWLTSRYGVIGTAVASALRNALDAAVVFWLAQARVARCPWHWRGALGPAGVSLGLLALALWPTNWPQALVVTPIGLAVFAGYTWVRLLQPQERMRLLQMRRVGFRT